MPVFEYEAKTMQGTVVKGRMEAVDETAVTMNLRDKHYFPVKIKPYYDMKNVDFTNYVKVKLRDIAIFCRQFSVVLTSGISILKGLEIVKEQTENKKLKRILKDVFENVQKGKNLSESMGGHKEFPQMLVNMVNVGEASGQLDRLMERMADYYDKEYKQRQKVKQALTYPAAIGIFAVLVVIILVVKVLPTFVTMITDAAGPDAKLPLPTRIVMGLSDVIQHKGFLILLVLTLLVFGIRMFFKNEDGIRFKDRFKLRMPIFGKTYKKIITGRFARTFGILISSGLPLIESITICSEIVGNAVVKDELMATVDEVKKGVGIGDTLTGSEVFPAMLTQMIKIGEEAGTLDFVLQKTAEFYDGEVETATARLTTMIEPLIIVFLGVVVGFIIISIMLPIFEMYNAVGSM